MSDYVQLYVIVHPPLDGKKTVDKTWVSRAGTMSYLRNEYLSLDRGFCLKNDHVCHMPGILAIWWFCRKMLEIVVLWSFCRKILEIVVLSSFRRKIIEIVVMWSVCRKIIEIVVTWSFYRIYSLQIVKQEIRNRSSISAIEHRVDFIPVRIRNH